MKDSAKPNPEKIPQELKARSQWVNWKFLPPTTADGKPRKVPFMPNGATASSTDPGTWSTFAEAWEAVERGRFPGVGYVFSENDPYVGSDFDSVLLNGGRQDAEKWVRRFGSYTETSVSGSGLHIIVKGRLPQDVAHKVEPYEIYDSGRYFIFTGDAWPGFAEIQENQAAIDELVAHMKATAQAKKAPGGQRQAGRHDTLLKAAQAMFSAGHSAEEVLTTLQQVNATFPAGPKSDKELEGIVDWARKHPGGQNLVAVDWGGCDPLPLPSERPDAPVLIPELVPPPLSEWVFPMAESRSAPPEFYFVSAAVPLMSACGWMTISPDRDGGFLTRPNVWGLLVGDPSMKKSAAQERGQAFLKRLEAEEREKNTLERFNLEAERDMLKADESHTQKLIGKAKDPHEKEALRQSLAELKEKLADVESRLLPVRYIVSEATVEKIADILVHNPHGLLLTRDEATVWLRGFDRKEHEADRSFFLEAWTGVENFAVDRISRGSKVVPHLLLSIIMTVQPGPLERYIAEAIEWAGKDGFLARFQLLAWPSELPEWNPKPFLGSDAKVMELFRYAVDRDSVSPACQDNGQHVLKFSPGAQEVYEAFQLDLNRRTRSELRGLVPAYCMHVQKFEGLVPKLALFCQVCKDFSRGRQVQVIEEESVIQAAALTEYFDGGARRLYSVELEPGRAAGRAMADRILKLDVRDGTPERDVYRSGWSGLPDRKAVAEAMIELERLGWVKRVAQPGLRRAEHLIRVNPRVHELFGKGVPRG